MAIDQSGGDDFAANIDEARVAGLSKILDSPGWADFLDSTAFDEQGPVRNQTELGAGEAAAGRGAAEGQQLPRPTNKDGSGTGRRR